MSRRPVARTLPKYRPAVPADMALAILPHRAAIGFTPLVSIELRPAPRGQYWVEVEDDRGACHAASSPKSAADCVLFARRFGVDAHNLEWEPDDCGPETTTNPFAE